MEALCSYDGFLHSHPGPGKDSKVLDQTFYGELIKERVRTVDQTKSTLTDFIDSSASSNYAFYSISKEMDL